MHSYEALIRRYFDAYLTPTPTASAADTAHRLQLTCAALLVELTKADHDMSEAEDAELLRIFRDDFALSTAEVSNLMALAHNNVKDATSLYQFTSLLNEHYDYQQKLQLLDQLWRVAFADGRIDRYEEHLIRQLCDLLYLSHGDFIRGKLAVKSQ